MNRHGLIQTWPYVDRRCLTVADANAQAISEQGPLSIVALLTGVWPARSAPRKTEQTAQIVQPTGLSGAAADNFGGADRNRAESANHDRRAVRADVPLPPERPDLDGLTSDERFDRGNVAWRAAYRDIRRCMIDRGGFPVDCVLRSLR